MEEYVKTYAEMRDDELIRLASAPDTLVDNARNALFVELAKRGIGENRIQEQQDDSVDEAQSSYQELITIGQNMNPLEAQMLRSALEAKGVKVWLSGEDAANIFPGGIGTRLQVRVEDKDDARSLIDNQSDLSMEMSLEFTDPLCPHCGSDNVTEIPETPESSTHFQDGPSHRDLSRQCHDCGHSWWELSDYHSKNQ